MATTITIRITGVASGGATVRVSEESNVAGVAFLLLEGDMQTGGADALFLEGDENGHLLLEGDEVAASDGTILTRRVTAAASGGHTSRVTL